MFRADGVEKSLDADAMKMNPVVRKKLLAMIEAGSTPIYLFGAVGLGKTCAAICAYIHWPNPIKANLDWNAPFFAVTAGLTRKIALMNPGERQREFKRIAAADLFVLDDIGRRKLSDEQHEILIDIVDVREGSPTIYTSQHHPDGLADALGDDRIASRILRGLNTIEFIGNDRRLG